MAKCTKMRKTSPKSQTLSLSRLTESCSFLYELLEMFDDVTHLGRPPESMLAVRAWNFIIVYILVHCQLTCNSCAPAHWLRYKDITLCTQCRKIVALMMFFDWFCLPLWWKWVEIRRHFRRKGIENQSTRTSLPILLWRREKKTTKVNRTDDSASTDLIYNVRMTLCPCICYVYTFYVYWRHGPWCQ